MSLITCCPACGTMFRVVPDQLKISEGWVRCGHCAEVFDATANMAGERPAAVEPPPPPLDADTEPGGDALVSESDSAIDSSLRESMLDQPFVFRRSDLVPSDEPLSDSPGMERELPLADGAESGLPDFVESQDLDFIRQARRKAFWSRPLVRALVALLAIALAALLAAQFAVQERDRLAASDPALRPWLAQLCAVANCRIEPHRQIEALAIDSSSFNRVRSDAYRLNFTLKNGAPLPVALPSMELTLTDSQDQPVVRRVIAPPELGASAPVIAAGAEWSASVALAVNADAQAPRVAGYRLLAFYP